MLENDARLPGGPADLINLVAVTPPKDPTEIWSDGDVIVSAIASRHMPGHMSYRMDTPAGAVVIGGDAGNDTPAPPREFSTSVAVEQLAQGAAARDGGYVGNVIVGTDLATLRLMAE